MLLNVMQRKTRLLAFVRPVERTFPSANSFSANNERCENGGLYGSVKDPFHLRTRTHRPLRRRPLCGRRLIVSQALTLMVLG